MPKKWVTGTIDGRSVGSLIDEAWVYDLSLMTLHKSKPGIYAIKLNGTSHPEPMKTEVFALKSLRVKLKPNCFRMIARKGKEVKFGNLNLMTSQVFADRARALMEAVKFTCLEEVADGGDKLDQDAVMEWGDEVKARLRQEEEDAKMKQIKQKEKDKQEMDAFMNDTPSFDEMLRQMKDETL